MWLRRIDGSDDVEFIQRVCRRAAEIIEQQARLQRKSFASCATCMGVVLIGLGLSCFLGFHDVSRLSGPYPCAAVGDVHARPRNATAAIGVSVPCVPERSASSFRYRLPPT